MWRKQHWLCMPRGTHITKGKVRTGGLCCVLSIVGGAGHLVLDGGAGILHGVLHITLVRNTSMVSTPAMTFCPDPQSARCLRATDPAKMQSHGLIKRSTDPPAVMVRKQHILWIRMSTRVAAHRNALDVVLGVLSSALDIVAHALHRNTPSSEQGGPTRELGKPPDSDEEASRTLTTGNGSHGVVSGCKYSGRQNESGPQLAAAADVAPTDR